MCCTEHDTPTYATAGFLEQYNSQIDCHTHSTEVGNDSYYYQNDVYRLQLSKMTHCRGKCTNIYTWSVPL